MPLCLLQTNVEDSSIPEQFEVKLSSLIASVLNKPLEKISVVIQADQRMCRNGTTEPTCILHLWSINVFSSDKNPIYGEELTSFLSNDLSIQPDRVVLLFHDITADQLGH